MNEETKYAHAWMYSFLPAGKYEHLFLAAFCTKCRKAATVRLSADYFEDDNAGKVKFTETNLGIFGCTEADPLTTKIPGLR